MKHFLLSKEKKYLLKKRRPNFCSPYIEIPPLKKNLSIWNQIQKRKIIGEPNYNYQYPDESYWVYFWKFLWWWTTGMMLKIQHTYEDEWIWNTRRRTEPKFYLAKLLIYWSIYLPPRFYVKSDMAEFDLKASRLWNRLNFSSWKLQKFYKSKFLAPKKS